MLTKVSASLCQTGPSSPETPYLGTALCRRPELGKGPQGRTAWVCARELTPGKLPITAVNDVLSTFFLGSCVFMPVHFSQSGVHLTFNQAFNLWLSSCRCSLNSSILATWMCVTSMQASMSFSRFSTALLKSPYFASNICTSAFKALMFAVMGPNSCCERVAIPSVVTVPMGTFVERRSIGSGQVGTNFSFSSGICA